jgi:pimeloyl-ACP methyl ester carboxylesterase
MTDPRPPGGPGVTRFVAREGQRLSYESTGEAAGPPLLALHDLLASRGQFLPLRDALLASGARVTLPDARGHGASPMLSGAAYPATALAADALAILDSEGLAQTAVVSVGWGAATALALAALAPQRITALVLAEPYLPGVLAEHADPRARQAGGAHLAALKEAVREAAVGRTDPALDLLLNARAGAGWRERLPKPRLGAIRRAAPSLGPLLGAIDTAPPDWAALRQLAAPITLLRREDALPIERWTIEAIVAQLPAATVVTVPAASGDALVISPDMTEAMVRAVVPHVLPPR